jgi:hypothetical protein
MTEPQPIMIQLVRAVDACTAAVRAEEARVEQLRTAVEAHARSTEGFQADLRVRVESLQAQLTREQDRQDRHVDSLSGESKERWAMLRAAFRLVWSSEIRLIIVAAIAGWLGIHWAAPTQPAPPAPALEHQP